QITGKLDEAVSIRLALSLPYVGMCLANYEVQDIGMVLNDFGKRLNYVLNGLAGANESKGRHHRTVLEPKQLLGAAPNRLFARKIWNSVRNYVDALGRQIIVVENHWDCS